MAKRIAQIMANNPDKKVLAILGAGHKQEITNIIRKNLKTLKQS